MKIKNEEDARKVGNTIVEKILEGKVSYFNITVDHEDGSSSPLHLTPFTPISSKQSFMAVDDYVKFIFLLMSHPNISDVEYDERHNCINAIFQCSFSMHEEEEWSYGNGL